MDAAADSDRVSFARIAGSGMNPVLNVAAVDVLHKVSDEVGDRVAFGRTNKVVNAHWR